MTLTNDTLFGNTAGVNGGGIAHEGTSTLNLLNVTINGNQVVAQRSLAELQVAIDAIRGSFGAPALTGRREHEFAAVLAAHTDELLRSPGKAWLELVREA